MIVYKVFMVIAGELRRLCMLFKKRGLFREAQESKYLPNVFLALIIALGFLIAGSIIGGIFGGILSFFVTNEALKLLISLVFGFIFTSILVFVWVRYVEKRSIASIGLKKEGALIKFFTGFIIGFILFAVVILILFISGSVEVNQASTYKIGASALGSILIVLPGWIVQSSTEEILSRGWLMNVIGAKYNAALGLFVSSILFGLLHLANNEVSILAIINIVLVGLLFGLYVIKTEDLWGACGMHAAWNWAQGNIFGLEVSGSSVNAGSLMDLELKGSALFTGGKFGPEAGIATTIVLTLGIIILLILVRKDDHNEK